MASIPRRLGTGALALAFLLPLATALPAAAAQPAQAPLPRPPASAGILYQYRLPDGKVAVVHTNGVAQIYSKDHRSVETRLIRLGPAPDKGRVLFQLMTGDRKPYAPNRVIVVYRDGVMAPQDVINVPEPLARAKGAGPTYTNNAVLNRALASMGVDRSERLFRQFDRSLLSTMRSSESIGGRPALNFANAYRLHITATSVLSAVAALSKLPSVSYVSADWYVDAMHATPIPISERNMAAARTKSLRMAWRPARAKTSTGAAEPTNYALQASAQSLLNAPSLDAAAAYDEIESQFHQLPGQGEIITNISLGDLDDASVINTGDPCSEWAGVYGPTTILRGKQRYLDMPSMPLIPTYTASTAGKVDGSGDVCGIDPYLDEIGLDFSMMAPLPHNLQRPGAQGSGYTDLLGVAPGAHYRLVVPASFAPTFADVDAALLAAAQQKPAPNVITTSIGYGEDQYGFPGRYLEEDALSQSVVQSIVKKDKIVVCISANDGTRAITNASIGPSGGSAPTNLVPPGGTPTNINDDFLSTIPGLVADSGAIDVGGTTLDDLFSNPPQYATSPQVIAQHAYAETRWTGFTSFSTGYGSRVDVSAPADNVIGLGHAYQGSAKGVVTNLNGGTSASAPETAASAAVLLQVARLTGHPLDGDPLAVRRLLEKTGSRVALVRQVDRPLHIGPQVDLRAAVETLFEEGGIRSVPAVPRVAVEQRRNYTYFDGGFASDTDPMDIDLQGSEFTGGSQYGLNQIAWITFAPDWEFLPKGATYRLFVAGHPRSLLAITPWARLLPAAIFQAAGVPLGPGLSHEIQLTYQALRGPRVLASTTFPLVFGPGVTTEEGSLAPEVPPVVTGATIPVTYDISHVSPLNAPMLVVSYPGRVDSQTGELYRSVYTMALAQTKGTVNVPVSALKGGGIYGLGIRLSGVNFSDFAFTRVAPTAAARPPAPLLSAGGSTPGHYLIIPYGSSFQAKYDVSGVPGATGALLEVSAAGPSVWGTYNLFNNPNGSVVDRNGLDSGSLYQATLSGTSGTATVPSTALRATLYQVVRVIPMAGSQAVGEAGEVSMVLMEGIAATDGGTILEGWGINQSGADGFITSAQVLASGKYSTSLETFDQTTNSVTGTVAAAQNSVYYTLGWGIFGGDIGLLGSENVLTGGLSFNLLNTTGSTTTIGAAWKPPFSSTVIPEVAAANQTNDAGVFFAVDQTSPTPYRLFTSNLATNTFGPLYDLTAPVSGLQYPAYSGGIGENTTTNTALLGAFDELYVFTNPPTLVTVNLASGAMGTFTGVGIGQPSGVAIDSLTNVALVPTSDGSLGFYNLASQTGTKVTMGGAGMNGYFPAVDQQHSVFLVGQPLASNYQNDNNAISRVLVYSESGQLLQAIESFEFHSSQVPNASEIQINPATDKGFALNLTDGQLTPFTYTP